MPSPRPPNAPLTASAALLQGLRRGPCHGLGLVDRVKQATQGRMTLLEGSVYPALRRLEACGFVTSFHEPPPPSCSGRSRIIYALTPSGEARALGDALELLALLGFAVPAPPDPPELDALRTLVASVRRAPVPKETR